MASTRQDVLMPDEPSPQARSLIGRSEELNTLARLVGLADAGPGRNGSVLLAGDAGVGKTRLLTELDRCARDAGWRVLIGHCLDFAGDSLPYVPFTEIFGRLAREAPALSDTLLRDAPALARLLPGRRIMTSGEDADREADRQGAHTREQLFEAVFSALQLASRSAPVLLVIEDVHWADPSTRDLLRFLFTRQPPEAVSVVVSYRADDLHRRHPLRAEAGEWSRLPGVARIHLQPLPDDAVREMVHQLEPAGLGETAVRSIVKRAEGNAFFVEELVAAARRGQLMLSADLADLLLVHLDALDSDSRTVLRAMSVAGRRVGHELLAHVMGPHGPDLDLALRAAVDRGLLVAGPEGYSFRHALLAEAIYDDLLPGERIRWHQAYADVLSAGAVEGTAAELARHAFAAGDAETALNAAIRAGDEAMTVGGPAEATAHYEMVLSLLAQHGMPSAQEVDTVDIALRANEAAIAAGTLHRALALVQDQLNQLPEDADPVKRALLLQAVASTALLDDTPLDALQCTTHALQLVTEAGPLRARIMATHARANRARAREDEARRWATAAAEMARELNLPAVLADATTTLARLTPTHEPDWAEQAEQSLRASIKQARDGADVAAELRSSHGLGNLLYELGRLEEARDAYQRAADRAVRMRRPWAPYGLDGRSMAAVVSYVLGEWETVLRLADVSTEHPPMFARAMLGGVGLAVAAGRGETGALTLMPKLRSAWEREGLIAVTCGAAAIDLYGDSGDIAAAIAVHDEVVELVTRLWADPVFPARIRLSGLLLGQLASAARKAAAAERAALCERGSVLRDAALKAGSNAARRGPESQAWLARTYAEHLRLEWFCAGDGADRATPAEMVQAWEECTAAFDRFGHVFEAARSRARLAQALRIAGDQARAGDEAARAMEAAKALGARPLITELRSGAALPSAPAEDRSSELTSREHEVLLLVAQGRSNRQIADQLYISAKTVSVHVSNILAKLEAASRTEAVALAQRRGLLSGEPVPSQ